MTGNNTPMKKAKEAKKPAIKVRDLNPTKDTCGGIIRIPLGKSD